MKFKFIEIQNLPRLAWCAKLGPNREIIEVIHGSGVEVFDDWFFEGTWDGPFDGPGFAEASTCFGTGGLINKNSCEFVSPTHHMQGIVTIKTKRDILVSNSIPFILTQAIDKPDIHYLNYYKDLCFNMMNGFVNRPRPMKLQNGNHIYVHMYCNIKFGDVDFQKNIKTNEEPPTGFEDYRERLVNMLNRVRENSTDKRREKQVYEPITMVSRGYDSVACSALAAAAGYKHAITMASFDPNINDNQDDDGTPVAKSLGLSIEKYDMDAWYQRADAPETEFVATAWGGVQVRLVTLEDRFPGTLVVRGDMGDKVWALNSDVTGIKENFVVPTPKFPEMGAISQWEFRLRTGYINIYPATYAATHYRKLFEISNSKEMSSWSIGGDYDRPIPRRIAEEAGVPREVFGQNKQGSIHDYPVRNPSVSGREDHERFLEEEAVNKIYPQKRPTVSFYFHWGINRTMQRYKLTDSRKH